MQDLDSYDFPFNMKSNIKNSRFIINWEDMVIYRGLYGTSRHVQYDIRWTDARTLECWHSNKWRNMVGEGYDKAIEEYHSYMIEKILLEEV